MKVVRILGWTMIWSGGLILAFLAYQLWGTGFITAQAQADAESRLESIFDNTIDQIQEAGLPVAPAVVGNPPPDQGPPDQRPPDQGPDETAPVLYPEFAVDEGNPFARIISEKAEVDHIVFEGVRRDDLKKGPGHMPWTPLPGQPGNAVISGHRTTYEAPFADIDLLEAGDEITVQTATGAHMYAVREVLIVEPTDVWVTEPREGSWLTLTTCHPKRSARQRLVVFAELVDGPNFEYLYGASDTAESPDSVGVG